MSGFVDIHHHILYGIDDGPATFDEMASMLLAASKDGIEYLVATPHTAPGVSVFDDRLIVQRLSEARYYCEANNLNLQIVRGAEILVTPLLSNVIYDRNIPTIEGTKTILVEFAPTVRFKDMLRDLKRLSRCGYTIVLLHMERYRCLMYRYDRIRAIKKEGILLQINCSAIVRPKGYFFDKHVKMLLKMRLIDFVATDAHDVTHRRSRMRDAYDILKREVGEGYAAKLVKGARDLLPM